MIDEESKFLGLCLLLHMDTMPSYILGPCPGKLARILMLIHGRTRIKKCLCSIREQYTNQSIRASEHEIGKEDTASTNRILSVSLSLS